MTSAFEYVTAEPWAITHDWLAFLVEKARRQEAIAPAKHPGRLEFDAFFLGAATTVMEGGTGRTMVQDGVAVIPVVGPIFPRANMMTENSGATSVTGLQRDLAAALAHEKVSSILLAIDSPGGAVSGVSSFADAVFKARTTKPVAAHVTGTGASAAYWIASAAERVSLDRTGVVGSIGVIAAVPKQVTPDKSGNTYVEIVSSNAPLKRPDPTTVEGYTEIRTRLDAIEEQFVADVARGRDVTPDRVRSQFGKGGIVVGLDAVQRRMADSLDTLAGATERMARVSRASSSRQQSRR